MAMLTLNGLVQNVYTQPASTDRETGEVRPESLRAQILCENIMESGEKKLEMVTLKVHTEAFKKLVGQKVRIPRWRLCEQGRYHVLCAEERSATHLGILKEKPRERLESFRARPVSEVLMDNTNDMQSVSRTRKKSAHIAQISPQATSHSADGARMAAALADGKPGAGGAKGSPPAGKARAGRETAALGINAKLPAPPVNPMARRVERFELQSVARDILPDSRTANACAFAPMTRTFRSGSQRTTRRPVMAVCKPAVVSGCALCVGPRWLNAEGVRYSKPWPCIAPVAAKCTC